MQYLQYKMSRLTPSNGKYTQCTCQILFFVYVVNNNNNYNNVAIYSIKRRRAHGKASQWLSHTLKNPTRKFYPVDDGFGCISTRDILKDHEKKKKEK